MKNSKKALFSLLCAAFCIVIFACASGGGGGGGDKKAAGPDEVFQARFTLEPNDDSNDKGTSKIIMTTADETIDGVKYTTYTFKGEVTDKIKYGVVDATLTPDDETLARMKIATAISFKMVTTDGRTYNVEAPISTVTDWGFHRFPVKNVANQAAEHKIDMRLFMQPPWATIQKFNKERLTKFRIQSLNAAEGGLGPFEFKVWDFKIYGPAPAGSSPAASATTTNTASATAKSSAADDKTPVFGKPTAFQTLLNEVSKNVPINIAGKQVKIAFEGDYWRGQLDGKDFLAGPCSFTEDADGAIITLQQSFAYLEKTVMGKAIGSWVKTPGPELVLEYKKGPPAKLALK